MDEGLRGTNLINHELTAQISPGNSGKVPHPQCPVKFHKASSTLFLFRFFAFFTSETCVYFKMGENAWAPARLSSCKLTLIGMRRLLCGLQRGLLNLLAVPEEKVVYLTSFVIKVGLLSCEHLYKPFMVSASFQASFCSVLPPLPCYSCTHSLRAASLLKASLYVFVPPKVLFVILTSQT